MIRPPDDTHDPDLRSWVESAHDPSTDFPIQNLPFGVFSPDDPGAAPRVGIAIGDGILDLPLRLQDRILVIADERLETCVLHADVVLDATVVEDRPPKARTAEVFQAVAFKEIVKILGGHADRAEQRETRVEIRLGHADLRALRRE